MASSSQVGNVAAAGDLAGGLFHEVFVNGVLKHVECESITAQVIEDGEEGVDYKLEGEKLVGAVDLTYTGNAMSTSGGALPDHVETQPVRWETTPQRRHKRVAVDNMVAVRGAGAGTFQDYVPRLFDQFWDAWKRMTIRQSVGGSSGYVAKVSARTSSTVVVLKDGYGHAGTDPVMHLEPGMIVAWLDATDSFAVKGAATITAVAHSTKTITLSSAARWETDGGATTAENDVLVFATTPNINATHFDTEANSAFHGVGSIVDPDDALTTVLGINEDNNPRWKPFREASVTFDHMEVTEHWRKLAQKSTSAVTANSHISLTGPAVISELARTMVGFQQQMGLGRTFEGGYQAVRIAGRDIAEDPWFYHDTMVTLCLEDIKRARLGGDAGLSSEDGSEWSRLPDFDMKEAYASEYGQVVSPRRNRHAALTGITLANVDGDDYSPSPNY